MKLVSVIPIDKSIKKDHLSYFTSKDVVSGMLVEIPVRKKTLLALVYHVEDLLESKRDIKDAPFNLKKITSIKQGWALTPKFCTLLEKLADYTASTTGAVLDTVVPTLFLENVKLTQPHENTDYDSAEKKIFQSPLEDRLSFYKRLIRESFAKKQSVFVVVPTLADGAFFFEELSRGIEPYTVSFFGDIGKKAYKQKYALIAQNEHPILIIGTASWLCLPRADIKTVILEHESSSAYKTMSKPYIDLRLLAELYQETYGTALIIGDTLLRFETLYREKIGELGNVFPPSFRLEQHAQPIIVDTKRYEDSKHFTVLSDDLVRTIETVSSHGKQTLLYTTRKGLAPITVCHDCHTTVTCQKCDRPLVLYGNKQDGGRIFTCNNCKENFDTLVVCKACGGWHLVPLGIGSERVTETLTEKLPQIPFFRLDKESADTPKKALTIADTFYATPGAILVGTDRALPYIRESLGLVAIVSFDTLFAIPHFRMHEKILQTLLALESCSNKPLVIQTRQSEQSVLHAFVSRNITELYESDLSVRKMLSYPPFSRIIKVSVSGSARLTESAEAYLTEAFEPWNPLITRAYISKINNQSVVKMILKIPIESWPLSDSKHATRDKTLLAALKALPIGAKIDIDPEDTL